MDVTQNHFEMEASDNILVDDIDSESIGSYGWLLMSLKTSKVSQIIFLDYEI